MSKKDLIDLIIQRMFIIDKFEMYSILFEKLMKKFDEHTDKLKDVKTWEQHQQYDIESNKILKQIDDLQKEYEKLEKGDNYENR